MKKQIIRTDTEWIKITTSGGIVNIFYGSRDETDDHTHTQISGGQLVYHRNLSGVELIASGANLVPKS